MRGPSFESPLWLGNPWLYWYLLQRPCRATVEDFVTHPPAGARASSRILIYSWRGGELGPKGMYINRCVVVCVCVLTVCHLVKPSTVCVMFVHSQKSCINELTAYLYIVFTRHFFNKRRKILFFLHTVCFNPYFVVFSRFLFSKQKNPIKPPRSPYTCAVYIYYVYIPSAVFVGSRFLKK